MSDARRLALHVLFLAGSDGLAAHLAAHWTKSLSNGCLEVEAAASGGTDLTAAPADLVVLIHAPGDPGPLVEHHCGGRIDWDLEADMTASPVELNALIRRHVIRLLGDLGMLQTQPGINAAHSSCPSSVLKLSSRLDARTCLLAA